MFAFDTISSFRNGVTKKQDNLTPDEAAQRVLLAVVDLVALRVATQIGAIYNLAAGLGKLGYAVTQLQDDAQKTMLCETIDHLVYAIYDYVNSYIFPLLAIIDAIDPKTIDKAKTEYFARAQYELARLKHKLGIYTPAAAANDVAKGAGIGADWIEDKLADFTTR